MNLKNAVLSLLAFTGNVASTDEVRAVRPGIRGDRPAGSVLPDADAKKKLSEGNAGAKSDLEEHRIVPEDDALDEDDEKKIGSEVEAPGHQGIYDALYATSNEDLLESKTDAPITPAPVTFAPITPVPPTKIQSTSICELPLDHNCYITGLPACCKNYIRNDCPKEQPPCEVSPPTQKPSEKPTKTPTPPPTPPPTSPFPAHFPGWCEDSKGRGYPQLQFTGEELSPDQCKARCSRVTDVKVRGVGVGKAGRCVCFLDRKSFIGCGKLGSFFPRLGHLYEKGLEGAGPVNDGTGDSNPGWECFFDRSLPPPTKSPTPLVKADFPGLCLDSNRWEYPGLLFKDLSPDKCKAKCNDILCQKVQGLGMGKVNSSRQGYCYCSLDRKYFRGCWEFDKESLRFIYCNEAVGGTGSVKHGTGQWGYYPDYDCFVDRSSSDASSSFFLDDSSWDDAELAHQVE